MALKTDYKDDILDTSVNEKRKFNMITNSDGTVSFEDVTTYSQVGDSFGAGDINETNLAIEDVNANLKNGILSYNPDTDYFGMNFNGTWKDILFAGLQARYLYNQGNEIVSWVTSGYTLSSATTLVSGVKNSTNIVINVTSAAQASYVGTNELIDFTGYSELVIEGVYDGTEHTDVISVSGVASSYIVIMLSDNGTISYLDCRLVNGKNISNSDTLNAKTQLLQLATGKLKSVQINKIYLR